MGDPVESTCACRELIRPSGNGSSVAGIPSAGRFRAAGLGSRSEAPRVPERGLETMSNRGETGTQSAMGELPDHVTETPHVA